MKRLAALGSAIVLAGCQWIPGTEENLRERAQQLAADQLIDPSSAQFRNVEVERGPLGVRICGEINGKNRMGGYVGFVRFVTDLEADEAWIEPRESALSTEELNQLEATLFKMRAVGNCPKGWVERQEL